MLQHNLKHLPLVFDSGVFYRDCTGITIGGLKILERHRRTFHSRSGKYAHWWKCECECGKVVFLAPDRFMCVKYPSCGCKDMSRKPVCPVMRAIIIDHRINTDKSTRQIGECFRLTKNMVIGILDRAGMIGQDVVAKREPIWFPPRLECVYPNTVEGTKKGVADGNPGDPGFTWCCAPVKEDSSYCKLHHSTVYISEEEARRRRQQAEASIATADLAQPRSTKKRKVTRGARSDTPASNERPSPEEVAEAA